ncbi:MAG: DUF1018 domain-containing protein [Helicobacteraceae bacterium]|jgi:hypothetical protein|nr:DUF1018 domain-containing protein [Helicobacteraceae bacterium]
MSVKNKTAISGDSAQLTEKQLKFRRDILAKIHLSDDYLFMKQNDGWREFLDAHFGVSSAKELGIQELKNLLGYLQNRIDRKQVHLYADARGGVCLADLDDRYYTCPSSERFLEPPDPTIALKATDKQLEIIAFLWDKFDLLKPLDAGDAGDEAARSDARVNSASRSGLCPRKQWHALGDFIRQKIRRVNRLEDLNKKEAQKITGVLRKIVAFYEQKERERQEAAERAEASKLTPANNPRWRSKPSARSKR